MQSIGTNRTAIPSGDPRYHAVVDFLFHEAELLDDRRHHEWLDLLSDDIRYVVPVRVTTPHTLADSALTDMAHMDEDRYSLAKRVERFDTQHAWAEDPPSRTRRYVTNVRCWSGDADGEIVVRCNLLLFRSRGDIHEHDLLSATRTDVLRANGDGYRLARREVLLDESVLRTQNLAVFL
jgi:3-phenylpropionate/cinnamic acid dioxygenase small subunit